MENQIEPQKQLAGTIQRNARVPRILDNWLVAKADAEGFTSVPELIVQIVREARETELKANAQKESESESLAA